MTSTLGIDMGPTGRIGEGDYLKRLELARTLIRNLFVNANLKPELEFSVNDGGPRRRIEVTLVQADPAQLRFDGDEWGESADAASVSTQVVASARAVLAQMLREQTLSMDRLASLTMGTSLGEPEVRMLDALDRFDQQTALLRVDEHEVVLCAQGHRQCSLLERDFTVSARVTQVGRSTARLEAIEGDVNLSTGFRLPRTCVLHLPERNGDGLVQHALLDAVLAGRRVALRVLTEVQMTTGVVVSLELVDFESQAAGSDSASGASRARQPTGENLVSGGPLHAAG